MLMIGSGNRFAPLEQIAERLLAALVEKGAGIDIGSLQNVEGLGPAKASALCASFELSRRLYFPAPVRISFPADVLPLVRHFADRKQEHFLAVTLNGAHEVIQTRVVTIGLVNRTLVHPREVFADAITDRAASIVVAHNHPSGNCKPSPEDRAVTDRLKRASDVLGVSLLDHIIFSSTSYYSFLEQGEL